MAIAAPAEHMPVHGPATPAVAENVPIAQSAQIVIGSLSSSEVPAGQSLHSPGAVAVESR